MNTRSFICTITAAATLTVLTGCTPTMYAIGVGIDPPRTEWQTLSMAATPFVPDGRQDTSYAFTTDDLARILRSTAPPNGRNIEVSTIGGILAGTELIGDTVYGIARGPSMNARHGLLPGDTVIIDLSDSTQRSAQGRLSWFDGRTIDLKDAGGTHRYRVRDIEAIHVADGRVIGRDYLMPANHSRNLYRVPGFVVDPGKANIFVPLHSVKRVRAVFTAKAAGSARWVAAGIGGAMDLTFGLTIALNENFGSDRPSTYVPISLLTFGVLVLLIE